MVTNSLDIKLFRDLKQLRAQTITTAILVICGVSLLVSSWSAFQSLRSVRDSYYKNYQFADIFAEFKAAPAEIIAKIRHLDGIESAEARIVMDGLVYLKTQPEPALARFIMLTPANQSNLNKLYIRRGRLPVESTEIEIAVHEAFAEANNLSLGDTFKILIQGQSEDAKIVGITISPEFVYALNPAAPLPDDHHFGIFWLLPKPLQRMAKMKDVTNSIIAKMSKDASTGAVLERVNQVLKPYGNSGAYERKHQLSNMFVEDEIRQQKASAIITPSIFLLVAAFLTHIILSRLVAIHRPQIATLKALGYYDREISLHYMKMILIMMLVGAIPGIFLGDIIGILLTRTYQQFFHFPNLNFSLSLQAAIIGLVAGITPALLGGWSGLRAIYKLTPAEAMRAPSPPVYKPSIIERWGLQTRISIKTKMVWRNLFFRPVRLLLSVLGICAALAVIVTGGSWNDMTDFLMATQFQRQQREDMSVSFLKPLPASSIRELLNIPGILAAEGQRSVPARLIYKNHKRELGITGWPDHIQMSRKLDKDLKNIEIPDNGILLSRYFQDAWGLKVGENIDIEILEGKLPVFSTRIAAFSDDLIGLSASMKFRPLLKELKEETGYNVVTLKVDPIKSTEVYVKLKNFSQIYSVNLKKQLYLGFQESMGGLIRVFTMVLIIFALAIAIGIIYNSVRVSFSERSWEMASLRILGFSKGSVFEMLTSEIVTQISLAIIPGCLAGWGLVYLSMESIHAETFSFPVFIEPSTFAMAILVIIFALIFSLLIMLRMIGSINLVDALKVRE